MLIVAAALGELHESMLSFTSAYAAILVMGCVFNFRNRDYRLLNYFKSYNIFGTLKIN